MNDASFYPREVKTHYVEFCASAVHTIEGVDVDGPIMCEVGGTSDEQRVGTMTAAYIDALKASIGLRAIDGKLKDFRLTKKWITK